MVFLSAVAATCYYFASKFSPPPRPQLLPPRTLAPSLLRRPLVVQFVKPCVARIVNNGQQNAHGWSVVPGVPNALVRVDLVVYTNAWQESWIRVSACKWLQVIVLACSRSYCWLRILHHRPCMYSHRLTRICNISWHTNGLYSYFPACRCNSNFACRFRLLGCFLLVR